MRKELTKIHVCSMLTNLSFLSLKRGGPIFGGPGLAKVGKLFEIWQVVAEITDHWLSEPTERGSIPVLSAQTRDDERCGFSP